MRRLTLPLALALMPALLAACGTRKTFVEVENTRRSDLASQSAREMSQSKKLPPIAFEDDSDTIVDSQKPALDKIVELLKQSPNIRLIIEGHTDDQGSDESNSALSRRRAAAVKTYIVSKGIRPDVMRTYGYGKRRPLTEDTSDRGRALNRRVEFTITPRNWDSMF